MQFVSSLQPNKDDHLPCIRQWALPKHLCHLPWRKLELYLSCFASTQGHFVMLTLHRQRRAKEPKAHVSDVRITCCLRLTAFTLKAPSHSTSRVSWGHEADQSDCWQRCRGIERDAAMLPKLSHELVEIFGHKVIRIIRNARASASTGLLVETGSTNVCQTVLLGSQRHHTYARLRLDAFALKAHNHSAPDNFANCPVSCGLCGCVNLM